MGVTFDYFIDSHVDIAEIIKIYQSAEKSFPSFIEFSSDDLVHGYFHPQALPQLSTFQDLNIKGITTYGRIKKNNSPVGKLEAILVKGEHDIGRIGLLSVNWHFKEKESLEMARCTDSFRIELRKGKRYFGYGGNGSKVCIDKAYAKHLMSQLIKVLSLPIRIIESGDTFFLEHVMGHTLTTPSAAGLNGEDPSAFLCEMKDRTVKDLVEMMKEGFAEIGTEKQNRFEWGASEGTLDHDPVLSRSIYNYVYEYGFPADAYDLQVDFSVDRLQDIQLIQPLFGPKDKLFTEICSFHLSQDNYANMHVITSQAGYRVYFELRLPEDVQKIRDRLGVRISKSYFGG